MNSQASVLPLPQPDTQRETSTVMHPAGEQTMSFVMQAVRASEPDTDIPNVIRPKVMIVDDEPINIEVLQDFLQEAGYGRFVSTSK